MDENKGLVKEGNAHFQAARYGMAKMLYMACLTNLISDGMREKVVTVSDANLATDSEMTNNDILVISTSLRERVLKEVSDKQPDIDPLSDPNNFKGLKEIVADLESDTNDNNNGDDLHYILTYSISVADVLNNIAAVKFIQGAWKSS
jgi:hypothetical protein